MRRQGRGVRRQLDADVAAHLSDPDLAAPERVGREPESRMVPLGNRRPRPLQREILLPVEQVEIADRGHRVGVAAESGAGQAPDGGEGNPVRERPAGACEGRKRVRRISDEHDVQRIAEILAAVVHGAAGEVLEVLAQLLGVIDIGELNIAVGVRRVELLIVEEAVRHRDGEAEAQLVEPTRLQVVFLVRLVYVSAEPDIDVAAALDPRQVQEPFGDGQRLVLHANRLVAQVLAERIEVGLRKAALQ